MKILPTFLFSLLLLPMSYADENPENKKKPVMVVSSKDGFPAGKATPEGVACDLARAFIKADSELFKKTCIAPFGDGEGRKDYESFLRGTLGSIISEAKKEKRSPGGPRSITKVFSARHLSKAEPALLGRKVHKFQDIMFVDVVVDLVSGRNFLNRTLVIKKADGKWYVHPDPATARELSEGLNDEVDSTIDFKDAYTIKKVKVD